MEQQSPMLYSSNDEKDVQQYEPGKAWRAKYWWNRFALSFDFLHDFVQRAGEALLIVA